MKIKHIVNIFDNILNESISLSGFVYEPQANMKGLTQVQIKGLNSADSRKISISPKIVKNLKRQTTNQSGLIVFKRGDADAASIQFVTDKDRNIDALIKGTSNDIREQWIDHLTAMSLKADERFEYHQAMRKLRKNL